MHRNDDEIMHLDFRFQTCKTRNTKKSWKIHCSDKSAGMRCYSLVFQTKGKNVVIPMSIGIMRMRMMTTLTIAMTNVTTTNNQENNKKRLQKRLLCKQQCLCHCLCWC